MQPRFSPRSPHAPFSAMHLQGAIDFAERRVGGRGAKWSAAIAAWRGGWRSLLAGSRCCDCIAECFRELNERFWHLPRKPHGCLDRLNKIFRKESARVNGCSIAGNGFGPLISGIWARRVVPDCPTSLMLSSVVKNNVHSHTKSNV